MLGNMYADIGYGMKSERKIFLRVFEIVKSLFYF